MNGLRRVTYKSGVVHLARTLHLSEALKKWYWRWAAPPAHILRLQVVGREVGLYVRTPCELRELERTPYGEEDFFEALSRVLGAGDAFFDIGSNLGKFAIPLAKLVGENGQVIAFEPEERNYRRIQENVQLNGLCNVRVYRKALGEKNGLGELFVAGKVNDRSSLMRTAVPSCSNSTMVQIVQGDALREDDGLPVPRAVKIDVEGYEYSVLCGLQRTLANPGCELLCCEIHPRLLPPEVSAQQIEGFARAAGFETLEMRPRNGEIHMIAYKRKSALVAR
jgi:FkbM family methyltransferase